MARRKAQSAIEFLMTYGWAVMIILAVVAILFIIGVFSPMGLAPNSCVLPSGLSCYGYKISDGGDLTLQVSQSTGNDMTITRLGCSESGTPSLTTLSPPVTVGSGRHADLSNLITCRKSDDVSTPSAGQYYTGTIYIEYRDEETGLMHLVKGDIAYRVEVPVSPTPG